MANGFRLFLAALLSFVSFIIAIVACAGSTSNYNPINKIFVAQLNLSKAKNDAVFKNVTTAIGDDVLPGYVNLGLWSYCISEKDSKKVDKCTSTHGIQQFNLQTIIYKNVDDNDVDNLLDSIDNVILPEKLHDKKGYYNNLNKCMVITIIIGIVLTFISFCFAWLRMLVDNRVITFFGIFFASTSFAALIISGGTSVGTYLYIKQILKQNYDEYGISLEVGRNYNAILWGSIGGSLLNLLLWCTVRSNVRTYITKPAAQPEKRIIL